MLVILLCRIQCRAEVGDIYARGLFKYSIRRFQHKYLPGARCYIACACTSYPILFMENGENRTWLLMINRRYHWWYKGELYGQKISYLLLCLVEWWEGSTEAGDIQVAGVQTHISGRESDEELIWVRPAHGVAHMTRDGPQETPLVLLTVHHQLQGVASLPQVLSQPAHDGHQVLVVLEHEGIGSGGGAHHGGVAVLLVYYVHKSPDSW